jgi:hypothetical protein
MRDEIAKKKKNNQEEKRTQRIAMIKMMIKFNNKKKN